MVELLNENLEAGFEATDELCVMITRRGVKGEPRVARGFGRTVVWFQMDPESHPHWRSGQLVIVGHAGKGKGWKDRMLTLFGDAVESWKAWQVKNGWEV
jgi:hypothetical protein